MPEHLTPLLLAVDRGGNALSRRRGTWCLPLRSGGIESGGGFVVGRNTYSARCHRGRVGFWSMLDKAEEADASSLFSHERTLAAVESLFLATSVPGARGKKELARNAVPITKLPLNQQC